MRNYLLIAALAACGVAQAVVLDDFSDGAINNVISSGSGDTYTGATVPGGFRYVGHSISANPFNLTHATVVTNGVFVAASKSSVDAMTMISYGSDNMGAFGGNDLNVDLSADSFFLIDVLSNDEPGLVQIGVRSSGFNGGNMVWSSVYNLVTNNIGGTQTIQVDFSDFGGLDFSDVDSISIMIDTAASGDVVLDSFQTAVPEPGTMIALAAGLGALAARRRRKNA